MTRLSSEESLQLLRQRGIVAADEVVVAPDHMPWPDDEPPLGLSFFRTAVESEDLSGMTLQRTFFNRSEVSGTSFRGSDLTESFLCWNDFVSVDFSEAVLARADLRG